MITKINGANQSQYADLFKRAWNELWYRGKFEEKDLQYYYSVDNTFTSLEDYFTRIGTLMEVDGQTSYPQKIKQYNGTSFEEIDNPQFSKGIIPMNYEFIMFPIDEPRFEIDANTREIVIPMNFRKLVGIQGDHIAETLIFSINRFVDYYDLLPTTSNDMNIYIQWVNENGEDVLTEISMIHYEADTQKILFGWPLTFNVTRQPRTIDFSVRFIVQDGSTVKYSLNTKTHQITIVKALQPTITSDMQKDDAAKSFIDAIKNSPSTDAPAAAVPYFSAPGLDLEKTKDIDDRGGQLKVQAVANGLGHIDYTRWTKGSDTITRNVSVIYEESSDETRKTPKTYYTKLEGVGDIYDIYTGTIPATETLYERYYILDIPASETDITGTYKAYAVNKTSSNISAEVASSECIIPEPSSIDYASNGNLNESALPKDADTKNVALAVKVNQDNPNDKVYYEWKYDPTDISMLNSRTVHEGINSNTYSITDVTEKPGYYQVIATPKRNRASGTPISSVVCRVTRFPEVPEINGITVNPAAAEGGDIDDAMLSILTAEMTVFGAQESDSITYEWYGKLADENAQFKVIEPANAATYRADTGNGKIGFNTASLYVYGGNSPITYKCIAKNILNGKESKFSLLADAPSITLI